MVSLPSHSTSILIVTCYRCITTIAPNHHTQIDYISSIIACTTAARSGSKALSKSVQPAHVVARKGDVHLPQDGGL